MMTFDDVSVAFLKALGVSADNVLSAKIRIEAGRPMTVEVEYLVVRAPDDFRLKVLGAMAKKSSFDMTTTTRQVDVSTIGQQ